MKALYLGSKKNIFRSMVLGLALMLVTSTAMIAQDKPAQCKLLVSTGFTITKIDGKKKTVNSGKTVTIPAGKHKLTYNHTYTRTMSGMPSQMSKYGDEIEFEFESGKSYKLDVSAEFESFGMRSPGPPEITEIN